MSWALIPLTEQQKEIQQLARDFARSELAPHSARWDREGAMDADVIPKLAQLGFLGMMVPEQYEGLGLDTVTYLVALEEIAAVDASVAVAMSVHNSLPTQMILRYGSEDQRARFLPAMARGESLGAFALSGRSDRRRPRAAAAHPERARRSPPRRGQRARRAGHLAAHQRGSDRRARAARRRRRRRGAQERLRGDFPHPRPYRCSLISPEEPP
jgi:hypothetical protein